MLAPQTRCAEPGFSRRLVACSDRDDSLCTAIFSAHEESVQPRLQSMDVGCPDVALQSLAATSTSNCRASRTVDVHHSHMA